MSIPFFRTARLGTLLAGVTLLGLFTWGTLESKTPDDRFVIKTTMGDITVQLDRGKAPLSTENFARYANDGFYDSTLFHRVMSNFMIQGGGFTADMKQKTTRSPIANEAPNGLGNTRGTIAMARTNDINSATSQFFINVVDNDFLNFRDSTDTRSFGYAVFGKVEAGMDVVDRIRAVKTGSVPAEGGYPMKDVPLSPVMILSVKPAP
ncbi:MAG: peptidylprolyl isomerase [Calditrichaeota bacterium]|nr:peptidylprolyl isomerase [Candidatus Cloacimonadota bacterium]MCB1047243.1 peptidylprolyl isomerase [Calditrichota bacterium]MCB9472444.1 peptidylprolyl isomerase [Candidatus Delongbacteria bacterium]